MNESLRIAVVVPCYRVKENIIPTLRAIPTFVEKIYVVDDGCPDSSGAFGATEAHDPRCELIQHEKNLGVGGAVKSGYRKALDENFDIVVKLDGDGQADPKLITQLIAPLLEASADYVKGNRFFSPDCLYGMPFVRLFGNSLLSFMNKLISGYWNLMDPTNGFTAIRSEALAMLPLERIANDYFFECDMLFRLNTIRAVVKDVPMKAVYNVGDNSSLSVAHTLLSFPPRYLRNFFKRIVYCYFVRDFNVASLELLFAIIGLGWGAIFGGYHWYKSIQEGVPATPGTVILAALPVIVGFQLLLAFLSFDTSNIPIANEFSRKRSGKLRTYSD